MRLRNLAATMVIAALASACGSSAARTEPSPSPASAQARTSAACAIVQAADATQLFGRPVQRAEVPNKAGAQSVCGFTASTTADTANLAAVNNSLNVYVYDGTSHYTPAAAKRAVTLHGVGDKAFSSASPDQVVVAFVKNDQTVLLVASITAIGEHPNPDSLTPGLVTLARTVAARM